MSGLFDNLRALRSLSNSSNPAWEKPIVDRFRKVFLRRFEEAKNSFCRAAVDGHFLPDSMTRELLGYSSSSSIDAIRAGKISLEKFDLLLGTIGSSIHFPSAVERRTETFIETTAFVRRELMKQESTLAFDALAYHCIEQSFAENRVAFELEHENDERGWIKHLLTRVQSVVPAKQFGRPEELVRLLIEWGPAYLMTKNALVNFVRE